MDIVDEFELVSLEFVTSKPLHSDILLDHGNDGLLQLLVLL